MTPEQLTDLFVRNLTEIRQTLGISQTELASRLGQKPSYVSNYETKRRTPTFENLSKIAAALNIEPFLLLHENGASIAKSQFSNLPVARRSTKKMAMQSA